MTLDPLSHAPRHDAAAARIEAYRGALVGVAVGDGLGAAFEGRPGPIPIDEIDNFAASWPLRTTDDTAMTIGVAESLLHCHGLDQDHLAATFAAAYARDPRRGYGAGRASLLERIASGEDWRTVGNQQFGVHGSIDSGAATRSTPLGIFAAGHPQHAADLARRGARVPHTHPVGIEAAAAQAAVIAVLVTTPADAPIDGAQVLATLSHILTDRDLRAALETRVGLAAQGTAADVALTLSATASAPEAVPTALCAFLRHSNCFPDAVRFAISVGGDTGTIASMTGALAGAHMGYSAIPTDWVERTERAHKLQELADRFVRRHVTAT